MKATEMLKQIKTLLRARVGLAQMTLEDGETVIEADVLEAGQAVFIVSDDERIPLPVGEYTTADGQTIVVAEEGTIAEVKLGVEDLEDEDDKEDEKEELEEVVVEDVPEIAAEEVAAIVEAVVEVVAPVLEEVKEQVEELKRKYESMEDKDEKEKMSSQKPARKPMKHNPEAKQTVDTNLYSQGAQANTTQNRVFNKIFNK